MRENGHHGHHGNGRKRKATADPLAAARTVVADRERQLDVATEASSTSAERAAPPAPAKPDDVEILNRSHAIVLVGATPVVLKEGMGPDGKPEVRFLSVDGFKEWMRPRRRKQGDRLISIAGRWLNSPRRRQYEGICFEPAREVPGYYNLWRGWAVEPDPVAYADGLATRFLDHIYENVCLGDDALYAWVIGWFAAIIQNPAEKVGTSLVLRGTQGTGKTIVGKTMGSLFGPHYTLVAHPRYITGQFNSHLVHTLLLQADEGFWAGDHTAEGKLRDLITGEEQMIEYKGKEPIRVRSHVRLFITGNSRWMVPAGLEERRFAVLDVSDARQQDHAYFAAIERDMANGGRNALLHYLLGFDLSDVPLRQVPETGALFEQKVRSLSSEEQWWLDLLTRGQLPTDKAGDGECLAPDLYASYLAHAQLVGTPRRSSETALGMFLRNVVPALQRVRRPAPAAGAPRPWAYRFPSLDDCRSAFTERVRQHVSWPVDEGDWSPAP